MLLYSAFHVKPDPELVGSDAFLELTKADGVLEVCRVSSATIHVFLRGDPMPHEARRIHGLAQERWPFDRIVLAVYAPERPLFKAQGAG